MLNKKIKIFLTNALAKRTTPPKPPNQSPATQQLTSHPTPTPT
jgi:hypothetical protein